MTKPLTSIRNPRVAAARKLLRRSERDKRGAFLVEGPTVVRETLEAGADVEDVFIAERLTDPALDEALAARGIAPWIVGHDVIAALSDTVTPQGVVAVARDPSADAGALDGAGLCLVLADVRDPGNAGTLVRTAAAGGADAVVFATGSVDPLHPKVVRAAAGALFRLHVVRAVSLEEAAAALRTSGATLLGTDADAERAVYDVDLTRPVAFVLGNEAWGLPETASSLLDERVAIPMPGAVESLNVSSAGAILLFEAMRQRRAAQGRRLSSGTDE